MKKAILIFLAVCAGCSAGGGSDGPNSASCLTTYGYQYDQTGETGLTLKATIPHYTYVSFNEMENEYTDIEACIANTNTPGPTVIFGSFDHIGIGGKAVYVYVSQTVYINTDQDDGPLRNCISDREFLRHEFVHHVLELNGEDSSHANPKFKSCDALGPKTCNGEYCE